MRRSATPNLKNIENALKNPRFNLVDGDLTDEVSVSRLVKKIKPDFFVNFGANSFVGCSWDMPLHVFDTNSLGVVRCLEAIKNHVPHCRFYSAGSSEEFGDVDYSPQDIKHPLKPRSPYGASKCAARHVVKVYRESYNLYAVHGILFNHEGVRRGEEFVTRKITKGIARICYSIKNSEKIVPIELGNIEAKRDWSDSEDFVEGVWLMLNQEKPKDYILSSGETHSIQEFVEKAFYFAGIEGFWRGQGVDQKYYLGEYIHEEFPNIEGCLVKINPKFYRPAEVNLLVGDSSAVRNELGWKPKVDFLGLVKKMVENDLRSS